jgi:hypothetical protein
MSQAQYNDFVAKNPPCGSSYTAITLDYLKRSFTVDFSPTPGDYYILLENISGSVVTYTIQISAIGNAISAFYSTTELSEWSTSYFVQTFAVTMPSATTPQPSATANAALPVAIVFIIIAGLAFLAWSRRRGKREAPTRVY